MPALLSELEQLLPADAAQEVAPPEAEVASEATVAPEVAEPVAPELASDAALSAEAPVPELADGAAVDQVGATASEQAFDDAAVAPGGQIGGGLYLPQDYQAACIAAGTPEKWDDKYNLGHTTATQWVQPYEGRYEMAFALKAGESAAQAVKDFVAGPTIGDYRVISVAEQMDELRDELGDLRFDEMFGSTIPSADARIPASQRLMITTEMYTIPFAAEMLAAAEANEALYNKIEEPEPAMVEARVEEKPEERVAEGPAPDLIAEELGVERQQELA
jgi:hypothetical protein